ncbi:hypothetical protein BFP97_02995 [Roseivirga sp. 4D4]|uniref:hypothetical protein n=1 Tax=Roseivirga sp. 4D4 TaxID=1889784 RepID=UPI000853D7BD|nr:hypothetical protein [Roseivirga sp. 4D4]OEK00534.1 hypothetical protein BFP97_02995 [Roseivirga sp. 4D4]
MKKTFSNFLKVALTISVILFFISFYYLMYNENLQLDADSMLLALLLVIFTALASVVISVILFIMHRKG